MKKLLLMVSIYDSGKWIENRLANLSNVTCREDIEVWCVNANSPDERDDTIPRKFPFHYVKLDKRISVYETWNYIIKNAPKTQFVASANTDDIVAPNCYDRLMVQMADKNVGLSYCSWYSTSHDNLTWETKHHIDPGGQPGHYIGNIQTAGVGHFPLWRRSLHDEIGFFDPQFQALADADWWARIHHVAKKKFVWINEYLGIYLWRNGENLWHRKITGDEWAKYHAKVQNYKK